MTEVSMVRLYALRAGYLLVGGGLAVTIWPTLVSHDPNWPLMNSVVGALLGGLSLMALLGLRYPLQMLPILLFELTWKAIWLTLVAVPLWTTDQLDARTMSTVVDCLVAVVLIPIIPWRYVVDYYVRAGSQVAARLRIGHPERPNLKNAADNAKRSSRTSAKSIGRQASLRELSLPVALPNTEVPGLGFSFLGLRFSLVLRTCPFATVRLLFSV